MTDTSLAELEVKLASQDLSELSKLSWPEPSKEWSLPSSDIELHGCKYLQSATPHSSFDCHASPSHFQMVKALEHSPKPIWKTGGGGGVQFLDEDDIPCYMLRSCLRTVIEDDATEKLQSWM